MNEEPFVEKQLTLKEAAAALNVSKAIVYRWVLNRWIRSDRTSNKQIRISEMEILKMLAWDSWICAMLKDEEFKKHYKYEEKIT